jgi:CBS domain-containing protein
MYQKSYQKCSSDLDLSRRNTFHAVHPTDTLLTVCELLAKGGVHRVPVVNEKGEVTNILSQSSLITFLYKNCANFTEFSRSLAQLHLGSKPVISVPKDVPAIEAFRLMDKKKISGVAVVDIEGKLVGNTSASDLKLFLKTPSIDLLNMPIMQFLNKIRQEAIDVRKMTK